LLPGRGDLRHDRPRREPSFRVRPGDDLPAGDRLARRRGLLPGSRHHPALRGPIVTDTSRALAAETINGLRRSSYPPLWRALRDLVEGAPLDDEHLDLVREVARKAESVAVWDDERILRSEEHTSELQSRFDLVCRLLLEKK